MLIRVIYKMDLIAMIYLANIFLAHHKGRKLEQFPGQFWGQEIFRGVSLDGDFLFFVSTPLRIFLTRDFSKINLGVFPILFKKV